MRLRREHPDDGERKAALELGQRRGRRGVAGGHDQLHALSLQVAGDLGREAPDLLERARAVREPGAVAEVDEVLVREGDEALVQDGQAAHARVEDADRARVHPRDSTAARCRLPFPPVLKTWTLALAAALVLLVGDATGSTLSKQNVSIPMDDGVSISATLYLPDGAPPAGGWPALVFLHGLSRNKEQINALVETSGFVGQSYVVLTFDARGHGQSGGLVVDRRPARDRRHAGGPRLARLEARRRRREDRRLGHLVRRRRRLQLAGRRSALGGGGHGPDVDRPLYRTDATGAREVGARRRVWRARSPRRSAIPPSRP